MAHTFDTKGPPYSGSGARSRSVEGFNLDGTELARRRKHGRTVPVKQLFQLGLAFLSFKVFLFFQLGAAGYGSKMAQLSDGALLERVAAKAMALDPVSAWVIDLIRFGLL